MSTFWKSSAYCRDIHNRDLSAKDLKLAYWLHSTEIYHNIETWKAFAACPQFQYIEWNETH